MRCPSLLETGLVAQSFAFSAKFCGFSLVVIPSEDATSIRRGTCCCFCYFGCPILRARAAAAAQIEKGAKGGMPLSCHSEPARFSGRVRNLLLPYSRS